MEISLHIPDDIAEDIRRANGQDIARHLLEIYVIQACQQRELGTAQLRGLLGVETRHEFEDFLAAHNVPRNVNENEFYSHHYLSEVFKGDIRERLEQWAAAEEADPAQRAPYKRLASLSGQWFAWRNAGNRAGDAAEQLASFQEVQQGLLQALGYAIALQDLELQASMPVSVWQVIGDPGKPTQVLVVPAYNPGQEEDDILDQRLSAVHYGGVPVPPLLAEEDFAAIVSDALFGADQAPRFVDGGRRHS